MAVVNPNYELNSDAVNIWGYTGTGVWVSPKGTTLPTGLEEPVDPWKGLGWLGPEGIELSVETEEKEINGLQSGGLIKKIGGKVSASFKWYCYEQDANILSYAHAGQPWTKQGTGADAYAEMDFMKDQNKVLEVACVVDLVNEREEMKRYLNSVVALKQSGTQKIANFEDVLLLEFTASIILGGVNKLRTNGSAVLDSLTP